MAAVVATDVVIGVEICAHAHGDGFLTDIAMCGSLDFACEKKLSGPFLK